MYSCYAICIAQNDISATQIGKVLTFVMMQRKSATPKALVEAFQKMQPSLQVGVVSLMLQQMYRDRSCAAMRGPSHLRTSYATAQACIKHVDLQGGSCLLIGDDSSLILEAQELAQTKLGCHVMTRGAQTGVLLAT